MTRYRILEVKYVGPTNRKPSRIKITDLRGKEFGVRVKFIPYQQCEIEEEAKQYFAALPLPIVITGEAHTLNCCYLLTTDFKTPLHQKKD